MNPSRAEIWWASLEPIQGHEQGRDRPVLIVSDDLFNHGFSGLVIVVPLTRTHRNIPYHVAINPPDGNVTVPSVIICEQVRSISTQRLRRYLGTVSDQTMAAVADRLRVLLDV